MSEPEGQELQDKLVTIWYVMDQYQRDVEQWHDQKRKLKEKKEYLEMNGTTSKVSLPWLCCLLCFICCWDFLPGTLVRFL